MNGNNTISAKKYFAAANTYHGFKSYFDLVFKPSEYEYIYVLKGGPGTGKSSLMRRIGEAFIDKGLNIEEIYCSSDPHSLDGVIIKNNSKRLAILDGTAPHERDAKSPMAKDEIINLASGLKAGWIRAKNNEIINLSNEKSNAYKTAYKYLALAGESDKIIRDEYEYKKGIFEIKNKADAILLNILESDSSSISTRLCSSFSRYGKLKLDGICDTRTQVITVSGDEAARGIFMNEFFELSASKKYNIIHFPTALEPTLTDAVYFPDANIIIMQGDKGEINANDYISITPLSRERIKTALAIKDESLNEAKRWFAIASDLHFRLEKIYGEAMDFEANDRICEELITKITNILEISI